MDNYIRELSASAQSGDHEAGRKLLRLFSTLARNPEHPSLELVRYVASCIRKFLKAGCTADAALSAFNVKKPAHRPINVRIRVRQVKALQVYYEAREEGRGKEPALEVAAAAAAMSISNVKRLLEDNMLRFSALLHIPREKRERLKKPLRKTYQKRS